MSTDYSRILYRIKQLFLYFCAALTALLLWSPGTARSGGQRKLTLMVYMCGSNLESGYGYATRDLREMMKSGFPEGEVTVLVMIGGSSNWMLHPDLTGNMILEIGNGRQRIVRESQELNMGSSETLTDLLTFGRENYPAEKYALILWDHGGGPMEGACWDELFSLDNLSLDEITEGIRNAGYPEKLSWVGFDACLMSSLEVASALAPYADYMIASQETEPHFGWNYAFLKDLGTDATGADTGRRIVDLYFEGHDDIGDVLTMACLDLSGAEKAAGAMDRYFSGLSENIDSKLFSQLSGIRMHTTGFGKGVRGTEESGYDLVDAVELIRRIGGDSGASSDLEQALGEMIVYSRSSEEGVNGVSLYHPYINKKDYLGKWSVKYEGLGFCPGYTQYIRAFGAILTGESLTEWKNLQTEDLGSLQFGVQLSPEQAENFADAQLLILAGGFDHMGEIDDCVLVYSAPARIDENGMVTGEWPARLLFAEDEAGELHGPLSFLLSDDDRYQVVAAVYTPEGKDMLQDATEVRYYLREVPGSNEPEIVQIKVRSEVTGAFTNRQSFSEDGYRQLLLWYYFRTTPESAGTEDWPAYMDWPRNTDVAHAEGFELPQKWKFRYLDGFRSGEQYFAVFQIEDTQQNVHSSRPVIMENPNLTALYPEEEKAETGDVEVTLSAYLDKSAMVPGLQLFVTCTNRGESTLNVRISDLVINETLALQSGAHFFNFEAGTSQGKRIDIPKESLVTQDTLRTAAFTVSAENETGEQTASARVQFAFGEEPLFEPEGKGPLASAEQDGIRWELLESGRDEWGYTALTFRVFNGSETEQEMEYGDLEINQLLVTGYWFDPPRTLRPGEETIVQVRINDNSAVPQFYVKLKVKGVKYTFDDLILADRILEAENVTEIRRISLLNKSNTRHLMYFFAPDRQETETVFTMEPSSAVPLALSASVPTVQEGLLLAESDRFEIRLQRLLIGDNGAALCMRAENHGDDQILFEITDLAINGMHAQSTSEIVDEVLFGLNPGMTVWQTGQITFPEALPDGSELEEISFTLRVGPEAYPVVLRPVKPAAFGKEGGTILDPGDLEAE